MAKRNEADTGSLSFKDRTLSKAAAKQLFGAKSANILGGIIDTTVVRIKDAKTTKAAKATEAYFAYSTPKTTASTLVGRSARTGIFHGRSGKLRGKARDTA